MARGIGHSTVIRRVISDLGLRSGHSSSIGSARLSNRNGDGGSPTGSRRNFHAEKGGRDVSRITLWRNRHFRGFQFSVLRKIICGTQQFESSMMQPNRNPSDGTQSAPVSRNDSLANGRDEEAEMRRVFQSFDENNDGAISSDEFHQFAKKLGFEWSSEDMESLLRSVDENGDGKVSFEEFYSLYPRSRAESEQSRNDKAKEEDLKSAFRVYDKDGDGYIDALELRSVLMSLKIKEGASLKKCEQMIKRVDVDGNGKVDFQEFKKMMSSDAF